MGTKLTIIVRRHSGVFSVKDYNSLIPLQGSQKMDNFQAIKLASFGANGEPFFNDTSKYQIVDYSLLKSLQFEETAYYGSIDAKMNWLVNHEFDENGYYTRPYWIAGGQLRFGTILFGQTPVRVETEYGKPKEYVRRGRYPNVEEKEDILFYRVVGGLDWVVNATAIEGGKPTDKPRGVTIKHPVWPTEKYPVNYGDGRAFIASAFLE